MGALKRWGLNKFLPLKKEGLLERGEGLIGEGGLKRGFTVSNGYHKTWSSQRRKVITNQSNYDH